MQENNQIKVEPLKEMEQYYHKISELNANLDTCFEKMREKANKDFQEIAEKYAQIQQELDKNIKIEAEVATVQVAKTIGNVHLKRVMGNIMAKKPEEELKEINNCLGIPSDNQENEEKIPLTETIISSGEEAVQTHNTENDLQAQIKYMNAEEEKKNFQELFPEGLEEEEMLDKRKEEYQEEFSVEESQEKKKSSFLKRILKR